MVGVPGTAHRPPEARDKPKVGGFTTFRADRILELEPDLVLAFSDLQAEISAELIRAGDPRVLQQPALGRRDPPDRPDGGRPPRPRAPSARRWCSDMRDEIRQVREFSSVWPDRPRVYFEEWHDPLIAGIRWVSEIIEIAGGKDIFPELRDRARRARARRGSRRGVAAATRRSSSRRGAASPSTSRPFEGAPDGTE